MRFFFSACSNVCIQHVTNIHTYTHVKNFHARKHQCNVNNNDNQQNRTNISPSEYPHPIHSFYSIEKFNNKSCSNCLKRLDLILFVRRTV